MKETIQELATLAAAALLTLMLVTSGTLAADKLYDNKLSAACEFDQIGVGHPMKLGFVWDVDSLEGTLHGNAGDAPVYVLKGGSSVTFYQNYSSKGRAVGLVSLTVINLPRRLPPSNAYKATHFRNFYLPNSNDLVTTAYEGTCSVI